MGIACTAIFLDLKPFSARLFIAFRAVIPGTAIGTSQDDFFSHNIHLSYLYVHKTLSRLSFIVNNQKK
ncbi:hypothetical protein BIV59_10355 [Bacillus sp. MUM 13]|nr:hypothetical protein BIV59_10355 [Bacillus sp. MUM 13]